MKTNGLQHLGSCRRWVVLVAASLVVALFSVPTASAHHQYATDWTVPTPAGGNTPQVYALALDPTGTLAYVADDVNDRVYKLNTSGGDPITSWAVVNPWGVAVDGAGNVLVSNNQSGSIKNIQKFDANGGFISEFGSAGTNDGQFDTPVGLETDSAGNIYVADYWLHRIQKFSSSGAFIATWGGLGTTDGQFNHPNDIAIDSLDNVYVTDFSQNRVQKFSSTGGFLLKWGCTGDPCASSGTGDGQLGHPHGIGIDGFDNVYVSDQDGRRLGIFRSNGAFVQNLTSYGANVSLGFTFGVDAHGFNDVYVGQGGGFNPVVVKYGNPAPAAAFTASPNPATVDQRVSFDSATSADGAGGLISARAWDLDNDGAFDDGTGVTASRSFSAPGDYAVRLQVIDDDGVSNIRTAPVTVGPPPPGPPPPSQDADGDGVLDSIDGCPTVPASTPNGCPGSRIVGTSGNDRLVGTPAPDIIEGAGGDDIIDGAGGNDTIKGGPGADVITGGLGDDVISEDDPKPGNCCRGRVDGGPGNDTIDGGGGGDSLFGGHGNDTISEGCKGPEGACNPEGMAGGAKLEGGSGNDKITGVGGDDILSGGPGNDIISETCPQNGGCDPSGRLLGGAGNDRLTGSAAPQLLNGGSGNDRISGGARADVLIGGPGRDKLIGGAGKDRIDARDGARDIVNGGRGRDSARIDRGLDRVSSVEDCSGGGGRSDCSGGGG